MRRSTSIVLVTLAFGLVACGEPPSEAFGLSLTPQGAVELRFGRCVEPLQIWVQRASDDSVRPVWEIVAKDWRSYRLPSVVVVGDVPPGYRAATTLKHPLERGVRYTVESASGEWYGKSFDFSVDELKPGYVLDFKGELVPEDEFPTVPACSA